MARTGGANQIKPTEAEINLYTTQLKKQAREGDSNAAGWLVMINAFKSVCVPFSEINGQIVEIRG